MLPGLDLAASRTAAAAVNHVLAPAAWARARLKPFAGRTVHVHSVPFVLALTLTAEGLWQPGAADAAPDLTLRLTPPVLARLALRDAAAWRAVSVEGDTALARELGFLAEHLRWEAEEDLSRVVGDVAAHRLAQAARALARWPRESCEPLARSFAAYWTEERPLVAGRDDVAAFNRGVDDLRDGLARLEARLAPLQPAPHRR
ncbi:MAG: ubiquinone biosynthesis accessory factor UbiJ [Myxococcota bacterium]